MSTGSIVSVVLYEEMGRTAPFYIAAVLCGSWALCVIFYFLVRYKGRLGLSFSDAEAALLVAKMAARTHEAGYRNGETDGHAARQRASNAP